MAKCKRLWMIGLVLVMAWGAQGDTGFFDEPVTLIAHRGGANLWPENTLYAFENAAARWPQVILEIDVRLTLDGSVVLLHDSTLDRTTDGMGAVAGLTLSEIQNLDAAHWFSMDGSTYPLRGLDISVPSLAQVFQALPDQRYSIEIKSEAGVAAVAPVLSVIQAYGMESKVGIASFDETIMQAVRAQAPGILSMFSESAGEALLTTLRAGDWAAYVPPDDILSIGAGTLDSYTVTDQELDAIRAKGITIFVWTVNDSSEMAAVLQRPVDGIMTDNPDLLAQLLGIPDLTNLPVSKWALLAVCALVAATAGVRRGRKGLGSDECAVVFRRVYRSHTTVFGDSSPMWPSE